VDGLKPDLEVMQSKAGQFRGHMQPLGRLINPENCVKGVGALVLRAVLSFSKCFPWHLARLWLAGTRLHLQLVTQPQLFRPLIANRLLDSECREFLERISPCYRRLG
jgi:hypothetical protein